MHDVLIIGAGVTGLTCAHELMRAGADVQVLERSPRAGGVVGTIAREGYRFESGPNTIPASARVFRELAGELGIAGELIVSSPDAANRYLFHGGRLRALPKTPAGLISTSVLSPLAKLRAAIEPFRRFRPGAGEEPTLEAFLSERFGRAVARTLGGAFVRGVYAAEVNELGAASAFPRLWNAAIEHGGVVRGLKRSSTRGASSSLPGPPTRRGDLLSFEAGFSRMIDAFSEELGGSLLVNAGVERLELEGQRWCVHMENGEQSHARYVVLATPASATVGLVGALADLSPLDDVNHADLVVVHLGLSGADLPQGFGFLVPPDEQGGPKSLGILFPSRIFAGRAPAGGSAVSAILRESDVSGLDDLALERAAHEDLVQAIGREAAGTVEVRHIERWRNVIPRYTVGHAQRMETMVSHVEGSLPGLFLAGAYHRGVSVEDCMSRGRDVGRRIAEVVSHRQEACA